ncbi:MULTISPECIES: transglycosylase family protein [Staphylococcus]|uniref:Transglycosylase n=1 Tax=Staphylococcus capitis TaxID=29388 RepID=A0A4U9T8W4_STACP|nr:MULTISPECIES: transglycosylase family protein [Staphylococcus]MBW4836912.1 transglycosylase family protein [Staphylococcaceae bacterium]AKL92382.1 putative transglycosylase SceD precursor [Staphylococcus capitis subsp. capitis]EFS16831.1 SceD protein [Staphylococcus capitis C87]MBC3050211.1 transglycosylase family protein [Staphylococcus capitis]MBC3070225.1 transglycosylase family protein [Staphylococcus capitis]
MKKTIIASSLAVGLGVVAGNAGHDAHASEATNVDKAELAQKAQSNDQSLNESPIQKGAYNVNFDYNGFNYHFESNGTHWSWNYAQNGQATPQQDVSNQTSADQVSSQQQTSQAQQAQPEQTSAPQTEQTQQPQAKATTSYSAPTNNTASSQASSNQASSGSSVNLNSHLKQIAQRESGGDIHAINPSTGAAGKFQFLQSTWDSVAPEQYKGQSPANAPESVQDAAAVKLYNTAGASQWVTA